MSVSGRTAGPVEWVAALRLRIMTRGVGRNSLFSMGQSIVQIVCMFLSYRFLIADQGLGMLGLWALLMVFGGLTSTFDIGGASALARSVARHEIEFSDVSRADVIHTVLLTSLAINTLMTIVMLSAVPFFLPRLLGAGLLDDAWRLLPWVAALMMVTPLAVGVSSSIDGMMRADQRAILTTAGAIAGLIAAAIVIPVYGVVGLAVSQIVQQGIVIVGGWLILRRQVDLLGWAPTRWHATVSRRTVGYAMKLNAIGILALLLDPLTKYCINHASGPAAVGGYELAARLAVQLRNLVGASATPLIPAFAASERHDDNFADLLVKSQRFAVIAAIGVLFASILAAPLMCLVILGHISADILKMNILLAFGWSVNLFSLPLYIAAQGQGYLRWNMMSHAVSGVLVGLTTIALVPLWGGQAVVFGSALGLAVGAAINIVCNALAFGQISVLRRTLPVMTASLALLLALCSAAWFATALLAG